MATREPRSIAEEIEELARLTEAPGAFVEQVRALFEGKGISLEEDVEPFRRALEEAFRREEVIRAHAERARRGILEMSGRLSKAGERCVRQLEELRKVRDVLQDNTRTLRESGRRLSRIACVYLDRRAYDDDEAAPLVPGPDDLQ